MTGIIIDLILILILVINIYLGYRRGLTSVLYKIIAFIVAIIIMFVLYKPISNVIINNTQIDENITQTVKGVLPENLTAQNAEKQKTGISIIDNYISEAINNAEKDVTNYVATQFSYLIVNVITMIILYVASRIVLLVIKLATDIIGNLPIISTFNRTGGFIYGLLKSLIIIYAILAVISVFSPMLASLGIPKAIEESNLGKLMYNNNIILKFIVK